MSSALTRGAFLRGLGAMAGSALLSSQLGCPAEDRPSRLLVVHKPCGTVPASYDCSGGERDFTLGPILAPFEGLRSHMVILDGLDIRKQPRTPGQDHGSCMVTFMTGGDAIVTDAFRAAIADRPSIDQLLARSALAGETPIRSLQLAADIRSDRDDVFTRTLSYSARARPLMPEHRPGAAFARLFGSLTDAALTPSDLERARARKQSVLDFSRGRIARLSSRLTPREREHLDSHLEAIRELERLLDRTPSSAHDLALSAEALDLADPDAHHGDIVLAHLDIIRTAFQLDLTRVATFGMAAGTSHVNFSRLIPGVEDLGHHAITHEGANRAHDEAAIHHWYNERLATFLESLRTTADSDGRTLLDNTLVVVFSEIHLGQHTFDNVPIQLFGGAGGRLQGDRLLRFGGRSTNDLWMAIAEALGQPMEAFGDPRRCDGPLPGIFA